MKGKTSTYDLVERIKAGDSAAFTDLFKKYRGRLAVLVHYKLGPALPRWIDTEDVLQETLLKGFRDFHQFSYQTPGSLLRWLARISEHVIADMARSEGRQKRRAAQIVRFRSETHPSGPEPMETETPSRILAQSQGVAALLRKLELLPEDYRQAILWVKVEGLSTQEVAERLGKSRENTALLLHRAIKRFRSVCEQTEGQ